MIQRKRLAAMLISAALSAAALSPAYPVYAAAWERGANGAYIGSDGSSLTGVLSRGVDVSHWKQNIDWNAVATDDIQFAMLGARYNNAVDPYFDANARGAYSAGLRIGVYLYSYATTTAMAEQEADFVLTLIKDYPISYPVVFDVEASEMNGLSPSELAAVINAFCKKIESAGYYPMLYTNDYWLSNKIDMSKIHWDVWVARYNVKPAYTGAAMWQATNEGQVNGISGNVDINFTFKNFSDKIPANRWRLIGGKWYYYKNHVKQTGWIHDGQSWYYLNADGTQYKGWLNLNGIYYYLDASTGQMKTGWQKLDNQWYFLKNDGTMANEWLQLDGTYYYLLNGVMVTGWLRIGSDYYYMKGDGAMVTGWRKMDGSYYFFAADGRLVRGLADIDGKRYYLQADGTMATGWRTIDNTNYYFSASGAMASGWEKINNSWYYFHTDGRMVTGWLQIHDSYYYLHTDGRMVTGWQNDGTNTYYMDPSSGKMAIGWKKIDGAWYYFNSSGHRSTGWLRLGESYYYLLSDGRMAAGGSYTINGINYTFNNDGICQNEASAIDGGSAQSVYTSPDMNTAPNSERTAWNSLPGSTNVPNYSSNAPGTESVSFNSQGMNAGGGSYSLIGPGSSSPNGSGAGSGVGIPSGTASHGTSGQPGSQTTGTQSQPGQPSNNSGSGQKKSGLSSYQTTGPR